MALFCSKNSLNEILEGGEEVARPREPIDLIIAKGKKHLTKEEIEERKSQEIKVPSDKVKAPSYLPKDLRKEFKKISDQLVDIGIMTNLDSDCLSRFLISQKQYVKITKEIEKRGPFKMVEVEDTDPDGNVIGTKQVEVLDGNYDALLLMQDRMFKQCRQAASDLGLTISSRCKLVVPKEEDNKPKNKFAKFAK